MRLRTKADRRFRRDDRDHVRCWWLRLLWAEPTKRKSRLSVGAVAEATSNVTAAVLEVDNQMTAASRLSSGNAKQNDVLDIQNKQQVIKELLSKSSPKVFFHPIGSNSLTLR